MAGKPYTPGQGKMRGLTPAEIKEFLDGPIIARLAMVKPDGAPYVVPIWQEYDGQAMYVMPRAKSAFVHYIREDPRVAVSCALDERPHTRVLIEGTAEIVAGPTDIPAHYQEMGDRMTVRYLGSAAGSQYLKQVEFRPYYVVKITPEKITSWTAVTSSLFPA